VDTANQMKPQGLPEKPYSSLYHSEKRTEWRVRNLVRGFSVNVELERVYMMYDLNITQAKARLLVKRICNDFKIDICNVWFIIINDPNCIGWYSQATSNSSAYMMIEKNWSRKLVLVLHEITHHIQNELYADDTSHGKGFQLAKKRVATWAKNNISDDWDWYYLIQRFADGRFTNGRMKHAKR